MRYDVGILNGNLFADSYSVDGAAELDGALEVRLVEIQNAGLPELAVGDSFEILSAGGGVTDQFSSTSFPTPPAGTTWRLTYNATSVVLDLLAGVQGDYNNDGIVDAADYTLWRDNLGSGTALANDDTPGVGPDDYTRWKTNFGQTAGSGSAGAERSLAAVPEPATVVLLLLTTVGWCLRRGRKA